MFNNDSKHLTLKVTLLFVLFIGSISAQDRVMVQSVEEFNSAVSKAQPGTTIVLANGVWQDAELLLEGNGTADAPIKLTVEEKGKVTLEGRSYLHGVYIIYLHFFKFTSYFRKY